MVGAASRQQQQRWTLSTNLDGEQRPVCRPDRLHPSHRSPPRTKSVMAKRNCRSPETVHHHPPCELVRFYPLRSCASNSSAAIFCTARGGTYPIRASAVTIGSVWIVGSMAPPNTRGWAFRREHDATTAVRRAAARARAETAGRSQRRQDRSRGSAPTAAQKPSIASRSRSYMLTLTTRPSASSSNRNNARLSN